ncbi:hypothetical protein HBZS_105100 [Helicobacter bizzozeronii CCUG 35545]|nr:hypothetical protein HBZS_105100 [Helicobacter bizzozeronii CCUG 35545]
MHYAPQSADWQKVQKAVEGCNSPTLKNYNTQRSKFQKAFDVLCQHLEPLLKDTPQFSTTEELQYNRRIAVLVCSCGVGAGAVFKGMESVLQGLQRGM